MWRATIHVWPYSIKEGGEEARRRAGDPVRQVEYRADGIREALRLAELYRDGIETNPAVWKAPIYKIELISS